MTFDLNTILSIVVPLVALGLGALLRGLFKGVDAEKFLAAGIAIIYPLVDQVSKGTQNTIDDKVALALKLLNEYYKASGKTLPSASTAKAEEIFKQLAGK